VYEPAARRRAHGVYKDAPMRERSETLAITPRLLIATDFDGTLARIVDDPRAAAAPPAVLDLLRGAARMPQTAVAVVSGRGLADLRKRLGTIEGAWLVGGHGAEISGPHTSYTPEGVSQLLESIAEPLRRAAPPEAGFLHERKATGIAVHFRAVEARTAKKAVAEILETIAAPAGMGVCHGKKVIDLLAVDADKGSTLQKLRHETGATGVIYLGDDVTDEDAFGTLGPDDLSIKIGVPPTKADYCLPSVEDAHDLIGRLVEHRAAWLLTTRAPAIQDHAILSDQRTIAVVAPDARVAWLCLPRADSHAVFASLLDSPKAGHWSVAPSDGLPASGQRYLTDTFTLETSWPGMRVTDYLDGSGGRAFQRAGRTDLVRTIEGRGSARVDFAPRLDFGRTRTRLVAAENGVIVEGSADMIVLFSPGVAWSIREQDGGKVASAAVSLDHGPVVMELRIGTRSLAPSRIPESLRRAQTERAWSGWVSSLRLPSIATDLCRRSALVLRALTYGPTGAVFAAGTTSLPETAGGVRNWDYRFCWPRDAAIAGAALVRLGNTGVAMRFLDWLMAIVERCAGPERLRPVYTVSGEELGPEAELSHLRGYRASRPVRIGNAAAQQVQRDVFGPIVDLVYLLAEAGAAISPDHWRLVEAMALAVERGWQEPDHGIWEVRSERRHHVHSKVMSWLALDRAVKLAGQFFGVQRDAWAALRDRIRDEVIEKGFEPRMNAFVAAYDLHEPDASALSVGLFGLIDPADSRFVGTVDLVQHRLLEGGTVYRYRYDDALAGPEGGFHICTGWLAESLLRLGRRDEAEVLFKKLCASVGPTGLLSEQWCPTEQTGLGNLAQAYSHAALINTAVALSHDARGVR